MVLFWNLLMQRDTMFRSSNTATPGMALRVSPSALAALRLKGRLTERLAPGFAARHLVRSFVTPRKSKQRDWEKDLIIQAGATWVSAGPFGNLSAFVWYPDDRQSLVSAVPPPTVLLVHGHSGRASQMGAFAAPLAARGFRVVAVDAPAHGRSAGHTLALPDYVKVLMELEKNLGPLAGVVAHSVGAAAVVAALSRGMAVGRVVLIAPPEALSGHLTRLGQLLGYGPAVARRAQQLIEARYGEPFEALRGGPLGADLTQQALVFHDEKDRVVPISEGETRVRAWQDARSIRTVGLGHNRILRDPSLITQVAGFISNTM
jgi:pimeloyl-ACP methyl ester carboxylesterase